MGEQATPVGSQSAGTAEDGHQHPGFDYVGWQSVMRGIFKNVCALLFAFFIKICDYACVPFFNGNHFKCFRNGTEYNH